MKRIISLLFVFSLLAGKASSQCTFVSPTVDIISTQTSGSNCTIVFNLSFDVTTNSGNKIIFLHLWKTADYPSLTYASAPTAAQLSTSILNVVIDNFGTPTLLCSYGPAPSVPVQCVSNNAAMVLTKYAGAGANGSDRFVISNVTITTPGACSSSFTFKGDAWSSNSNSSTPSVQCSMLGFQIGLNDPLVNGVCVSGTPGASYNFNISTVSSTLAVYYDVYLDDGDGLLVPSNDILINSRPIGAAVTISPTTPFNSGNITYPVAYDNLTYANRKIFIVVAAVGRSYLLSTEITPCAATVYDYGDLPTSGGFGIWPAARVKIVGSYNTSTLQLDNTTTTNTSAVWAGNSVGVRTTPFTGCTDGKIPISNCDPNDDGLGFPVAQMVGGTTYQFAVTINGNLAGLTAYYGFWVDWNGNGNFADDLDFNGAPAFYSGNATTQSPRTVLVNVIPPGTLSILPVTTPKIRLIVSGSPITSTMFNSTTLTNGEVEDYTVPSAIILPLDFNDVSASMQNCKVQIKFDADNEINNRFFRVEQSTDGVNWHVIAIINSKGNGDNKYSFTDTKPSKGTNFYKIQQVDIDARYTYSKILSVVNNCDAVMPVEVYPNPIKDIVTVRLPLEWKDAVVKISNAVGQYLITDSQAGNTLRKINTDKLASGYYLVQIIANGKIVHNQKIVK